MADADHWRQRATRLLALALQAREQGRIENAEQLTQLATQALDRATPPHVSTREPSRSIAQQQQQPQPGASDAAEPYGHVARDKPDGGKPDGDRNT
jgi:hypothetical protein